MIWLGAIVFCVLWYTGLCIIEEQFKEWVEKYKLYIYALYMIIPVVGTFLLAYFL